MAIIYSYPLMTSTVSGEDLLLITDVSDNKKTKSIKVSSLPSSGGGGGDTYTLQAEAKSSNSIPLKLDAAVGSDSTVNLTEGSNITLTRNSATEITIASTGGGSPDTPLNSVQFNNNSAFGGSANLTFSTDTLTIKDNVIIRGDGTTNAGKLRLECFDNVNTHYIDLIGPDHGGGAASYSVKFPATGPGGNQKILQSDASGNLSWINTPSSGGGGSVDSVNTTDGTYINLTPNSATTGAVTVTADLSAADGTSDTTTRFLSKDNTWDVPSYTSPQGSSGQYQYNNGSSFAGADNLRFDADKIHIGKGGGSPTRGQLVMYGDGVNSSDIQLYNSANNRYLTLAQQAGATQDLTLTFPGQASGGNNKILESDSSGQLSWIDTPSGDTYALQAEAKVGTSVPLKLDAGSGTDSTVNLTEGSNITLTRNSSNQITIAALSAGGSGISPFPIYQASHSVAVGGQTIIRQSVCETAGTYSRLEYFSVGASSYPVYFAIYTGTITAAGSATKRLEGYNATSSAGINVINFSSSYNFLAGQDIIIIVSGQDTVGLAGSTALLSHVDICRGASVYTSSFPSTLDVLLDGIEDPVATGVCTHIY